MDLHTERERINKFVGHARQVAAFDVSRVEPEHVDYFDERGPHQVRIHLWGWLGRLAGLIIGRMHRKHPLAIRLVSMMGAGPPAAGLEKPDDDPSVRGD